MERSITKVAAVIIRAGKLLLVRKRGTDVFISPGGKPEVCESDREALSRELSEELGVEMRSARHFGRYVRKSALEAGDVHMHVYAADIWGAPKPMSEIEEILWADATTLSAPIPLGSVFAKDVLPELARRGLVRAADAGRDVQTGAYVFDLDGTIYSTGGGFDERIIRALNDIPVSKRLIFATSRSRRGVVELRSRMSRPHEFLLNNGSCHMDQTGRFGVLSQIAPAIAESIVCDLEACGAPFYIEAGNQYTVCGAISSFPHLAARRTPLYAEENLDPYDRKLAAACVKICVAGAEASSDLRRIFLNHAGDIKVTVNSHIDIMRAATDKRTGLTAIGVQDYSYVAFGNDDNDFEMLSASRKGYAIGGALSSLAAGVASCEAIGMDDIPDVLARHLDEG